PRDSAPRPPHSFPTRRSSDLCPNPLELAREGLLPRALLLFFHGQTRSLLLEPRAVVALVRDAEPAVELEDPAGRVVQEIAVVRQDRKSTRLNSSHRTISYAVF